jgi:hypothetical protein
MSGRDRGIFHVEGREGEDVGRWRDEKGTRSRRAMGKDWGRVSTRVEMERCSRSGRGFEHYAHCADIVRIVDQKQRKKRREEEWTFGIRQHVFLKERS